MTWESRKPRLREAPDIPSKVSTVSLNGREEEVKRLLNLGVNPCGIRFEPWGPTFELSVCGRPESHQGPHDVFASQAETAALAGIPEWMS